MLVALESQTDETTVLIITSVVSTRDHAIVCLHDHRGHHISTKLKALAKADRGPDHYRATADITVVVEVIHLTDAVSLPTGYPEAQIDVVTIPVGGIMTVGIADLVGQPHSVRHIRHADTLTACQIANTTDTRDTLIINRVVARLVATNPD